MTTPDVEPHTGYGLTLDDTQQARIDKLDAVLAQTSTSIEHRVLFADMLSLPNDDRYPKLDLPREQRRQKTLQALVSQMEALTRRKPVPMIFEHHHRTEIRLKALGRLQKFLANQPVLRRSALVRHLVNCE